jgi:hypothetical protein
MNPPVTKIIASHLLFLFVRAKKIAANQRPGFLQKKNPLTRAEKKSTHQIELNTHIVIDNQHKSGVREQSLKKRGRDFAARRAKEHAARQ